MKDFPTFKEEFAPLPAPEEMAKVIFVTYSLSQGNPIFHSQLLEYVRGAHPNWSADPAYSEEVFRLVEPRVKKFLNSKNHRNIPDETIDDDLREKRLDFERIFVFGKTEEEGSIEIHLAKIYFMILNQDSTYISPTNPHYRGGRPGKDTYDSHIVRFLIKKMGTGSKEFDQMFEEIRNLLPHIISLSQADPEARLELENLSQVISAWQEKHPDQDISAQLEELGIKI